MNQAPGFLRLLWKKESESLTVTSVVSLLVDVEELQSRGKVDFRLLGIFINAEYE